MHSWFYTPEHGAFIESIPELKEDEIYISHVGDGEYNFNVFGSAHKDIKKFLLAVASRLKIDADSVKFFRFNDGRIYIIRTVGNIFIDIAVITIKKIDPEEFPIGER
jgi:hypothetical protein